MKNKPDVYDRDKTLSVMKKHNLNVEHFDVWVRKFVSLRSIAPKRGVICTLKLSQYLRLAIRAGLTHPDQIGRENGCYHMGRRGDTGNYEWGNCRFITQAQNYAERAINGGDAAGAEKRRGHNKHNNEVIRVRAARQAKAFVLTSPHGKVHRGTNLKEFAEKHDLTLANISRVCNGLREHHKGWVGHYA